MRQKWLTKNLEQLHCRETIVSCGSWGPQLKKNRDISFPFSACLETKVLQLLELTWIDCINIYIYVYIYIYWPFCTYGLTLPKFVNQQTSAMPVGEPGLMAMSSQRIYLGKLQYFTQRYLYRLIRWFRFGLIDILNGYFNIFHKPKIRLILG